VIHNTENNTNYILIFVRDVEITMLCFWNKKDSVEGKVDRDYAPKPHKPPNKTQLQTKHTRGRSKR
jgi:hypothetical protein